MSQAVRDIFFGFFRWTPGLAHFDNSVAGRAIAERSESGPYRFMLNCTRRFARAV